MDARKARCSLRERKATRKAPEFHPALGQMSDLSPWDSVSSSVKWARRCPQSRGRTARVSKMDACRAFRTGPHTRPGAYAVPARVSSWPVALCQTGFDSGSQSFPPVVGVHFPELSRGQPTCGAQHLCHKGALLGAVCPSHRAARGGMSSPCRPQPFLSLGTLAQSLAQLAWVLQPLHCLQC